MKKTVSIDGMMCEHCQSSVKKALEDLGLNVEVSLEEGKAYIESGEATEESITQAIEDLGFDVTEIL